MKKVWAFIAALLFPVLLVVIFLVIFEEYTQFMIGRMYKNGYFVEKDVVQAKAWYRKSAMKGLASAQNALGLAIFQGEGDRHDKAEALKWYLKAAEQNHVGAQYNLAIMYSAGYGVWRDYVKALMWLELAASQGHENARKSRRLFVRRLPSSDAALARQMAEKWRARHGYGD